MAVGDIIEVDIDYGVHQRALKINLWYEILTQPGDVNNEAQDCALALAIAGIDGFLGSLMSDQARLDCIKAWIRADSAGAPKQGVPGYVNIDNAGQLAGEALPDNLPLVIIWEQTAAPAAANGRMFLSGIREVDTDGNNVTNAFQTGPLATFETNWETTLLNITGPDGGSYRQALMSKHASLPVVPLGNYGNPIDVTGVTCNPILRNLRRRQSRWEGPTR